MTNPINAALASLKDLLTRCEFIDDCGPEGEGWQSDELVAEISDAKAAIAALEGLAAQPQGEVVGWATHHDVPMLFPTREEAANHCDDDEEPIPLYTTQQTAMPVVSQTQKLVECVGIFLNSWNADKVTPHLISDHAAYMQEAYEQVVKLAASPSPAVSAGKGGE